VERKGFRGRDAVAFFGAMFCLYGPAISMVLNAIILSFLIPLALFIWPFSLSFFLLKKYVVKRRERQIKKDKKSTPKIPSLHVDARRERQIKKDRESIFGV